MSEDIVARLREFAPITVEDRRIAADEIERLRAELDVANVRLDDALRNKDIITDWYEKASAERDALRGLLVELREWFTPYNSEKKMINIFDSISSLLSKIFPPCWTVYKDVKYGPYADQAVDLYLLNRGVHPVVVMIHGGGWSSGDKSAYEGRARKYAWAGFHVIAINYRLAKTDDYNTWWPAQLDDVQSVMRWIRQNAPAWRIDASRIGVAGDSAGAHLAMMLGTTQNRPNCLLNMFGPCDLTTPQMVALVEALPLFGGRKYADFPELYKSASPVKVMTAYFPPIMTMHGIKDETIPFYQAIELGDRLLTLGVKHQLIPFNGGHGFVGLSTKEQDILDMQGIKWFSSNLGA